MAAHKDHDPEFDLVIDEAAQAWLEEQNGDPVTADHPDTLLLIQYQEGTLSGDEAEYVRRHLEVCPDCQAEILALQQFDDEPTELPVDQSVHASSWETFAHKRQQQKAIRGTNRLQNPQLALAASLVLAVIGLTSFFVSLSPPSPEVSGAPIVFDLMPDDSSVARAAPNDILVSVPPEAETLVVVANYGEHRSFGSYDLTLSATSGEFQVELVGAVRDRFGRFALTVPRLHLRNDNYQLTLWGVEEDHRTQLAQYSFRLTDDS